MFQKWIGKQWWESFTMWGLFLLGVGQAYTAQAAELGLPAGALVGSIVNYVGIVFTGLGIRRALK